MSQPGSRVDKRGVPLRQRHRDSGANERTFAGRERHIGRRYQVGSGVARVRVRRQGHAWVESQHKHVEGVGHGARPYATLTCMDRIPTTIYEERLRVPISWWLLGLLAVGTTWLTTAAALSSTVAGIVTLVVAVLITGGLIAYGRAQVTVSTEGFRAGTALLPLWAVGQVTPLDAAETHTLAGPQADPRAFLELRGYIRSAVRVQVADESDPTPYWLVSTRYPARCAQALDAAKARRNT
jgi:Protein of unknown function (DUF3093)